MRFSDRTKDSKLDSLIPFAITVSVVLVGFYFAGVYPFGSTAALREDGIYQYVGYYGWFSRVLHGEASIDYSFSKSLGGSTFGLFAYYLASPLNLIFGFFGPDQAAKVVSFIYVVKLGLCSTTAYCFLKYRFAAKPWPGVLLASFYGLSVCNFVSGANLMWLDGQIMLPLICLGVWKTIKSNNIVFLPICVCLAICFNWYSAYMAIVFSVLWLVFELIDSAPAASSRTVTGSVARYAMGILTGALLSAAVFLPTALCQSIANTGASPTPVSGEFFSTSLFDILHKNYIGYSSITGSFLVDDYYLCSVVAILSLYYFLFKRDSITRKVFLLLVVASILACECSPYLSLIWTGFSRTDSFNPRFHFCFVFVLIVCSTLAVKGDDGEGSCSSLKPFGVEICGIAYCFQGLLLNILMPYQWQGLVYIQAALIAVTTISLTFIPLFKSRNKAIVYITFFSLACVFAIETVYPIKRCFKDDISTEKLNVYEYSTYLRDLESISSSVSKTKRSERLGFSTRGVSTTTFPSGENMAVGLNGIGHYSSAGTQALKDTLGALGYCSADGARGIVYYNAPMAFVDQMLGVVSAYSRKYSTVPMAATNNENSFQDAIAGNVVECRYENSAPLGFEIQGEFSAEWANDNPFDSQQSLGFALSGIDAELYHRELPRYSLRDGVVRGVLDVKNTGPLYVKVLTPSTVSVYCNGEFVQAVNDWEFVSNILYLGSFSEGETVEIEISPISSDSKIGDLVSNDNSDDISQYFDFRTLDETTAIKMLDKMRKNPLSISKFADGHIEASVETTRESKVFLSIPSEPGWSATVNGNPCELLNMDGFITIPVGEGTNSLILSYSTPGKKIGLLASALGVILLRVNSFATLKKRTDRENGMCGLSRPSIAGPRA